MDILIRDMASLQQEQLRLQALILQQKTLLQNDMRRLREQLEPAGKVLNTVQQFTGNGKAKSLLQTGLGLGLDALMGRTLFRTAGPVARVAVPFLIRNVSSGLVSGKLGKVAGAIGGLFKRKKKATAA